MRKLFLIYILFHLCSFTKSEENKSEAIMGKWMSEEGNLEVEVYKTGNEYRAKVIWFDDSDDPSQPMAKRWDTKNPDKALRTRKVIGMEIMHGMSYNAEDDEWQNGRIYDASTGKEWNAKAFLTQNEHLTVRGFWHFEFVGQNILFKKVL